MRTLDQARDIVAGGPQAVANELYGGQWGEKHLHNTEPGDGYTYRGRGFIQLTGRENYQTTGDHLDLDLVNHPDDAAKPDNAARIAVDFWNTAIVKRGAENDVAWTSRIINGGTNGLADREAAAAVWERKLDAGYRPGQPDPTDHASHTASILREGSQGDAVKALQGQLDQLGYTDNQNRPLTPDTHFGPSTKQAVQAFQNDQGLKADGAVGPATSRLLDLATQGQDETRRMSPGMSPSPAPAPSAAPPATGPTVNLNAPPPAVPDFGAHWRDQAQQGLALATAQRQQASQTTGQTTDPSTTQAAIPGPAVIRLR